MPQESTRTRAAAVALGCVLIGTAALYAPTLDNGYVYDDEYIAASVDPAGRANPMVSDVLPLAEYFRAHYWKGHHDARPEYRPITILSYALVIRASRRDGVSVAEARNQHALNVALHVIAVALVALLLRALRLPHGSIVAGAGLFGVHAIHSEAVASVVGRAELLAFGFGASGLLAALSASAQVGVRRPLGYAGASVLFFAAFCSKEGALAWIPFLWVVAAARVVLGGDRAATAARATLAEALRAGAVPTFSCGAVPLLLFAVLRSQMLAELPAALPLPAEDANPLAHLSVAARILSATMIYVFGLAKLCWPWPLASDYGPEVFRLVTGALDVRFVAACLALFTLGAAALRALPGEPRWLTALAAALGFGFATSNLLFPIGTIFGERLLYAPSLGLAIALGTGLASRRLGELPARGRWALGAGLVVWLAANAAAVIERNPAWQSNEALYLTDAAVQPRSKRLQILAADVYAARGDRAAQFDHIERAFRLERQPARAWLRLGWVFQASGQLSEAEEALGRGLRATAETPAPGSVPALDLRLHLGWTLADVVAAGEHPDAAPALRQVAVAAARSLQRRPETLAALQRELADLPQATRTWLALGQALVESGDAAGAEFAFRNGLASIRGAGESYRHALHWNLGLLAKRSGRNEELADQLAFALHADPARFRARLPELIRRHARALTPDALFELLETGEQLDRDASAAQRAEWPLYRGVVAAQARLSQRAAAELRRALPHLDADDPRRENAATLLALALAQPPTDAP